jgi:hypothetical protein
MATVIHMMLFVVFVYLVVSIHIQFHQKSYQLPWGYTSLLKLLPVLIFIIFSSLMHLLAVMRRS